jgi:hypothetical protein
METLEYLEQVLSGLRSRYTSGDKSVEMKLRAVAAKVDQLKLQKEMTPAQQPQQQGKIGQQIAKIFKRRSCCR